MTITAFVSPFEQLYKERCTKVEDKYVPNFWNPQKVSQEKFCLYGDEDCEVEAEWSCENVILKLIAAGLELELEVGEYVRECTKNDLPDDPFVRKLLLSNVADEARHFRGFQLAKEAYTIPNRFLADATELRHEWQYVADRINPLLVAMAMEIGVFLPFLGCTRLFGGKSLATMSSKIAQDEYRHVITNRSVLAAIGIETDKLPGMVQDLVDDSLEWAIADLNIPEEYCGEDFNLDFVREASKELIETGEAEAFNDVLLLSDHYLPFENTNISQYDRVID